jgi:hypothetical protein
LLFLQLLRQTFWLLLAVVPEQQIEVRVVEVLVVIVLLLELLEVEQVQNHHLLLLSEYLIQSPLVVVALALLAVLLPMVQILFMQLLLLLVVVGVLQTMIRLQRHTTALPVALAVAQGRRLAMAVQVVQERLRRVTQVATLPAMQEIQTMKQAPEVVAQAQQEELLVPQIMVLAVVMAFLLQLPVLL